MSINNNFQVQHANPDSSSAVMDDQSINVAIPKVDVIEEEGKTITYLFELPGINPESLSVNIENNNLNVNAYVENEQKIKYLHRERTNARFNREISIPVDIVGEEVSANYQDGILKVKFPKATSHNTNHLNKEKVEKEINI